MRRALNHILPLVAMIVMALPLLSAAPGAGVTVKTSLDSVWLLMGKVTPIHVEITTPAELTGRLALAGDTLVEGVEVAAHTAPDTTELPDGRLRITQDIVIQSFDSGNYVIPGLQYIAGSDTFRSNTLALKVVPVDLDTLTDIHDYASPAVIAAHTWDWVPDWIADYWWFYVLCVVIIGGLIAAYFFWWRRRPAKVVLPPVPVEQRKPHEVALSELEKLHGEELCEHGQEKEFYTRLTDILREYIDKRFNINAMEMTSQQILRALKHTPDGRLPEVYMRQILSIADYVKFAKMRPFSDDNARAYADAIKFVEDTAPKPVQDNQTLNAKR